MFIQRVLSPVHFKIHTEYQFFGTMTLTEPCDSVEMAKSEKTKGVTIGETLQEVVWQALEQGRLTCGVHDCAHQLEIDPYNIMLCILPADKVSAQDVSTHIHHMLIEAFCREYDIRLVKVDSLTKLASVVKGRSSATDNGLKVSRSTSVTDVSCLILQYPHGDISEEEGIVAEHYKSCMFSDTSQTCVIALPD